MLLVNLVQALFHSTIVTFPLSESEIIDSRSSIFLVLSCSSLQSSQVEVSSSSLLLPSSKNVAEAPWLAFETPIIEAAVTPEPPPLTIQMSSDLRGFTSSTMSSAKQTNVHLRPSLSIPISTSPPELNISFSISSAAASASIINSGCKSKARHLRFLRSNAYDLVTPLAAQASELNLSPRLPCLPSIAVTLPTIPEDITAN